MKDSDFNRKLAQLNRAHLKYKALLDECESEYERRYGVSPSDAENDMWIESYHVVGGAMTAKEVDESHVNYCRGESYYLTEA